MICEPIKHFTLKENTLKRTDLDDFVACYNPKNRHERKETGRFKSFTYETLIKRDEVNFDIFWLKDEPSKIPPASLNLRSSPRTSSKTSKRLSPNSQRLCLI